jgi:hypothetical protein
MAAKIHNLIEERNRLRSLRSKFANRIRQINRKIDLATNSRNRKTASKSV